MKELITFLNDGNSFVSILLVIFVLVMLFYWVENLVKTLHKYLDAYADKKNEKKNISNLTGKMVTLEKQMITLTEMLDKDMQVIHRKEIRELYEKALRNNGELSEKDMKDYHYALDCYKSHNGNSYVQDEIEPYMKTVKIKLN